ncbi:hypothetical protein EGW08_006961 [Elysia chlorotica]|uniref:C-type lectin domain-containing protein n=1 Tax=Elysia chlorotica TaxID=188477 RepID=A0A3S0ZT45_ELYCH|nr:hypothetical protein EGW08_006961 [Elysia chlorotica]
MCVAIIACLLIFSLFAAESKGVDWTCPRNLASRGDPDYMQVWNNTCLHFVVSKRRTYGEASRACRADGGTLVLPKTKALNDYLADQLIQRYGTTEEVWIGLHDKKEEKKFKWEDNSDLSWHNFAFGNGPDNDWLAAGIEDCVAMDAEGDALWYDYPCDSNQSQATRTNPSKIYICQFNLENGDVKQDSRPSLDIMPDVSRTVDNTCPPGVLATVGSHFLQVWDDVCIHFVLNARKTYRAANMDCRRDGGTLALPKTEPHNDFLADQLLNFYDMNEEAWIGLHDTSQEAKFVWEDNSELRWANFAPGNGPVKDGLIESLEDCVAMDPGNQGLWYDHQCDENLLAWATLSNPKKIYICQYPENARAERNHTDSSTDVIEDVPTLIGKTCPTGVLDVLGNHFLRVWNETCFYFGVSRRKTYGEASDRCRSEGGTLALPKTKALNDFLADQLRNQYAVTEVAWIGLHGKRDESKYVWEDNTDMDWEYFAQGNGPNNGNLSAGYEDCVAMDPLDDGHWYDNRCSSKLLSLAMGSNPRFFFICQYKQGMARTVENTCPARVRNMVGSHFLKVWNDICFRFVVSTRKTYTEASKDCMKEGGMLALPKSKSLNDFLASQLLNFYGTNKEAWIGLHDKKQETKFVWEDNSNLEWQNFAPGSGPGNYWLARSIEDCVAMDPGDQGLWYDYQCNSNLLSWITRSAPQKIYICQYTQNGKG